MSALDKAFIKAYTKDPSPAAAGREDDAAGLARSPYVDWYETVPAGSPDGPYGGDLVYRIEDAHAGPQGLRLAPHTAFAASPTYSDPAYVSPYHAPSSPAPPTAEAARTAAALPGTPAVLPPPCPPPAARVQAEAAPQDPDVIAERSADSDSQTTRATSPRGDSASALEPQRTLKLRTIFTTAEADTEAEPAFSPDWEVDRLSWPPICERLLEAEERYFHSVGQRLKAATQDSHHVVMITGARRGEGRTTLALCLARCAAQAGVSTALVDADLKNPQLGSRLGMETPCGWLQVVADQAPLSETAVSSLEDRLTLFPLTGSEDLEVVPGDPSCVAVLQTIAAHYPLVIVDTGPLGSDGRHLFAADEECPIDTAIVVRDLRNTTEKKALATAESLQRSGVPAVGIAENFREADISE
jgi:Mrp family chromosome partitioning ATPase